MTQQEYIEWLDSEISRFDKEKLYSNPHSDLAAPSYQRGLLEAYELCRVKFLMMQLNDIMESENSFTNGLD
jgi:hypothetical protein